MAFKLDKSKLVKNLALKYKYVTYIDRELERNGEFAWEFKHEPKVGDDAWHPSGDCTPSLNYLYLKAKGELQERAISGSLRKTFMVGHFWHQYLQYITVELAELASWEEIERRGSRGWGQLDLYPDILPPPEDGVTAWYKPYHWVTGSADIAPCALPGHGDYLIDFKTMNALDFKRNDPPAWAADKWECQMNIYMDFFDLEKTLVIGVCKDSPHDLKEFEFHRNQDLIDAIYKKWKLVSECLDQGVVPPEDEEFHLPLQGRVTNV